MENPLKLRVGGTYRQAGTGALLTCYLEHEGWKGNEFRFLLTTQDGRHRFWYNEAGRGMTSYALCEEVASEKEVMVVGFGHSIKLAEFESAKELVTEAVGRMTLIKPSATHSLCPDCFN